MATNSSSLSKKSIPSKKRPVINLVLDENEADPKKAKMGSSEKTAGNAFLNPRLPSLSYSPGNHPLSTTVIWYPSCKNFRIQGKVISGLTTGLLQKTFYPQYQFEAAIYPTLLSTMHQSTSSTPTFSKNQQKAGMRRGILLDKKLDMILFLIKEHHIPQKTFYYPSTKKITLKQCKCIISDNDTTSSTPRQIQAAALKLRTAMNSTYRHARLFMTELGNRNLVLDSTQVCVGIQGIGATRIDGLLRDHTNRLIPFELKSGGSGYFYHSTKIKMNKPFQDQNDSKYNQALLQLAIGTEFYTKTFPQHDAHITTPMLFRITTEKVYVHPLPDWASSRIDQAISALRISRLTKIA